MKNICKNAINGKKNERKPARNRQTEICVSNLTILGEKIGVERKRLVGYFAFLSRARNTKAIISDNRLVYKFRGQNFFRENHFSSIIYKKSVNNRISLEINATISSNEEKGYNNNVQG